MHNLLTGKPFNREVPDVSPDTIVDEPWTAEAHLAASRRLLNDATGSESPADLIAAARVHVEAAKVAGRTPTPIKTGRARTLPRDGDAL